jgi:hypothetical protein
MRRLVTERERLHSAPADLPLRSIADVDVIDTVKRVAGVDFKVELAPRRAGAPAQIVAACD